MATCRGGFLECPCLRSFPPGPKRTELQELGGFCWFHFTLHRESRSRHTLALPGLGVGDVDRLWRACAASSWHWKSGGRVDVASGAGMAESKSPACGPGPVGQRLQRGQGSLGSTDVQGLLRLEEAAATQVPRRPPGVHTAVKGSHRPREVVVKQELPTAQSQARPR